MSRGDGDGPRDHGDDDDDTRSVNNFGDQLLSRKPDLAQNETLIDAANSSFTRRIQNDTYFTSPRIEDIAARYQRVTDICVTPYGVPISYCYYFEGDPVPQVVEHTPIVYELTPVILPMSIKRMWKGLAKEQQDKLYEILDTCFYIWKRIFYENGSENVYLDEGYWTRKEKDPVTSYVSRLKSYGGCDVMEYLTRGRTPEEMEAVIETIRKRSSSVDRLEDLWTKALRAKMTNGVGRDAVRMLLAEVIDLFKGLSPSLPVMEIDNITSPIAADACSITSHVSPEDRPKTRSSGSVYGQPSQAKRARVDSQASPTIPKKVTIHARNRRYVDMKVTACDESSGCPKYLFLVEIHSMGKSMTEAENKFTEELVSTLQCQSRIFGLLFSKREVKMYQVVREQHRIAVEVMTYSLIECIYGQEFKQEFQLNVAKFQSLIMDLFSCLIYGSKYIDV